MKHIEWQELFVSILMISGVLYSILMSMYSYKNDSKKVSLFYVIASILIIIVTCSNAGIIINVIFNILDIKEVLDISLIIIPPILLTGNLMFVGYEKTATLFLSVTISIYIIFLTVLIMNL